MKSDLNPLEMISKKMLTSAPACLQRMLLHLQRYDYTTTYRPGKEMILADSLSRMKKITTASDKEMNLEYKVCFIQFSSPRLMELREKTQKDTKLSILCETITQGFPQKQREIHSALRKYWSFCDQLSIEDDLVLKGECVIIPSALRRKFFKPPMMDTRASNVNSTHAHIFTGQV